MTNKRAKKCLDCGYTLNPEYFAKERDYCDQHAPYGVSLLKITIPLSISQ